MLKTQEAVINGLYDDPSGYATYGVGHLVQKFPSVLLETATTERLCISRVKTMWPGTRTETPYLEREVVGCRDFQALKVKAAERAPQIVAAARYQKSLKDLTEVQRRTVDADARWALAVETGMLNHPVNDVLAHDVRPSERAVNRRVTGVMLTQGEFDALVSFVFNVGVGAFADSTLLTRINENRYRTGDAAQRERAIDQIEQGFLAWSKSGDNTLPGLLARRQAEADAFLATARAQLVAMTRKHIGPPKPGSR